MNRLKEIRTRLHKPLFAITAEGHVSTAMLSAIERFDYRPTLPVREKIARVLGVPVEEIWPGAD